MRQASPSTSLSVAKGLITANEYGVVLLPRTWRYDQTMPVALYCPALSAGGWNVWGWQPAFELVRRGFAVVSSDLGDTPSVFTSSGIPASVGGTGTGGPGVWGNAASLTKLTAVYDYAMNTLKAAGPKVCVMGGSHGGAAACLWAAANPTKTACLLLGIGTVDTQDILTNNRGTGPGYRQSIQAAWGLGASTTMPANSTGVAVAPSFTFPVWNLYSTDDPICVEARHTAFAAANPSRITSTPFGAVGHNTSGLPASDAADWVVTSGGF